MSVSKQSFMRRLLEVCYHFRGLLVALPYVFQLLVFVDEYEVDSVVWPVGLLVFSLGVSLRIWAQIHLHYRLKIRKILTATGPYAYVRNPIYR